MKKLLLLIACMAMFVGCEKENATIPKEQEKPNVPIININLSSEVLGVNQLLTIDATSVDQKGHKLTVAVNDKFGWSSELLTPVQYRPSKAGDCTFDFTSKSPTGEQKTVSKSVKVVACDFMFGLWDDKKDDIIQFEDGVKDSGFTGNWLNYSGGDIFKTKRSYYFTDDEVLSKGKTSIIYTVSGTDPAFATKILLLTDAWKSQIAYLTKEYGVAITNTFPIEFDSWTQVQQINYIQTDIKKTKAVFKNTRSEVIVQIYNYGNSNLGFNTETTYSKV